jgi:hypothetical protein
VRRIVPPLAEKAPGHFAACIKEPAFPWEKTEVRQG